MTRIVAELPKSGQQSPTVVDLVAFRSIVDARGVRPLKRPRLVSSASTVN